MRRRLRGGALVVAAWALGGLGGCTTQEPARAIVAHALPRAMASPPPPKRSPPRAGAPFYETTAPKMGYFGLGVGLADLDGDGDIDLATSNGGISSPQSLTIAHQGGRNLPQFAGPPDWYAAGIDYHGRLTIGDVNDDGWLDIAVAVPQDIHGNRRAGGVQLFLSNNGDIAARPSYRTGGGYGTAGCTLADIDGDGDLDLIVPVLTEKADPFTPPQFEPPAHQRIYLNRDGALDEYPSWVSEDAMPATDAIAADVNDDGLMDVVFGADHVYIYYGLRRADGIIELPRKAGWVSEETSCSFSGFDVGWLGKERRGPQLIGVASSSLSQPGCRSSYLIYDPRRGRRAIWEPDAAAQPTDGQAVLFADVDHDGQTDLLAIDMGHTDPDETHHGGPLTVFPGSNGSLSRTPNYTSDTKAPFVSLATADILNQDPQVPPPQPGDPNPPNDRFPCGKGRAVFTASQRVQRVSSVLVKSGNTTLAPDYAWTPGSRAFSFRPPAGGADCHVELRYVWSPVVDVVTAIEDPKWPSPQFFWSTTSH